jgi:hypothetical protein
MRKKFEKAVHSGSLSLSLSLSLFLCACLETFVSSGPDTCTRLFYAFPRESAVRRVARKLRERPSR